MTGAALAVLAALAAQPAPAETPEDRVARAPFGDVTAVETWLADNPDEAAEHRRAAYADLCEAHGRASRYREAHLACAAVLALSPSPSPGALQSTAFWRALADAPPLAVTGQVDAPLTPHWTNMGLIDVTVDGRSMPWAVDTGAEVSVLSESQAADLGVRLLGDDLSISGSTPGVAAGRIGLIDRLRIGEAELRNLPVFVLPDAALTVPSMGPLPPILGMTALYPFEHVAFLDGGTHLRLGFAEDAVPPDQGAQMTWNPAGFDVVITLESGGELDLHLDTGSNETEFHEPLAMERLSQAEQRRIAGATRTSFGVTGSVETQVSTVSDLSVRLGDGRCTLARVVLSQNRANAQGRAGMDLVRACGSVRLDFASMRAQAF
ncbi:retropepsin-like aspartic protease [Brevundimonas sp. 2R-24]|uniref:Retropepsin-like aspartic protease n=1 Tax=Peiella sedimenti TaxID=3061083 RepID=A0ABT8SJM6_9CAUL|nr:retropepsin-like aspartic protease [Caulobacteraceae bacterium XZ-24]